MIHVETRDRVTLLTLDRPERRNAVDGATCEELASRVGDACAAGARAIVLAGAGPHFCAGADLTGVEDDDFARLLRGALGSLRDAPVPTIAAVHGAALGAGTQLAIACDLRVAQPDARFGIPAARLGLMVDHWTVQRLALLAGFGPARAMLLACEEVSGTRAVGLGLADREGGPEDAMTWAAVMAEMAPLTIAGHKLTLNRLEPQDPDPQVTEAFRRAWASEDLQEGRVAFAEKRSPVFRGR